jgi:hypothetical protein
MGGKCPICSKHSNVSSRPFSGGAARPPGVLLGDDLKPWCLQSDQ